MSDSFRHHGWEHTRLPCPLLSPRVCSNSCLLSWWCHPTISSSVTLFSSCPQSFPAAGSFPVSWFVSSGGQSIETSASASADMNISVIKDSEWKSAQIFFDVWNCEIGRVGSRIYRNMNSTQWYQSHIKWETRMKKGIFKISKRIKAYLYH